MATSQAEPFYRIESTHEEVIFQKMAMTYASARQEIVSMRFNISELYHRKENVEVICERSKMMMKHNITSLENG